MVKLFTISKNCHVIFIRKSRVKDEYLVRFEFIKWLSLYFTLSFFQWIKLILDCSNFLLTRQESQNIALFFFIVDLQNGIEGCSNKIWYWLKDIINICWKGSSFNLYNCICVKELTKLYDIDSCRHDYYLKRPYSFFKFVLIICIVWVLVPFQFY